MLHGSVAASLSSLLSCAGIARSEREGRARSISAALEFCIRDTVVTLFSQVFFVVAPVLTNTRVSGMRPIRVYHTLVCWVMLDDAGSAEGGGAESWRKAAGVEPTRKRLTPPPGFEAQPYHRVRVPSRFVASIGASRCRCVTRANPARGAYSRRDRRIRGSGWSACGPDLIRRDSGPHRRRRAVARDG